MGVAMLKNQAAAPLTYCRQRHLADYSAGGKIGVEKFSVNRI
jgi:hypothetical protein